MPLRYQPNVFAGPYLDRLAGSRKDASFVAAALEDPGALLVPIWHSRSLLRRVGDSLAAALLERGEGLLEVPPPATAILLGRFHGRAVFAIELEGEAPPTTLPTSLAFEDLRLAGGLLTHEEAGLLAYARAMVSWRRRHRHCGSCGAPNEPRSAGHVMSCTNPACGEEHFPRLDPAIIVLVQDGDRALLGRQAAWPPGRYSTLAGFVEPGESLEDAVAREVHEESGIEVASCRYHSSQPWPFPSSLMIGFLAEAEPGQQPQAADELEDARWFTREDIAAGHPALPPPQSVSFRLIEDWYDAGSATPLRQTPGAARWGDRR